MTLPAARHGDDMLCVIGRLVAAQVADRGECPHNGRRIVVTTETVVNAECFDHENSARLTQFAALAQSRSEAQRAVEPHSPRLAETEPVNQRSRGWIL